VEIYDNEDYEGSSEFEKYIYLKSGENNIPIGIIVPEGDTFFVKITGDIFAGSGDTAIFHAGENGKTEISTEL